MRANGKKKTISIILGITMATTLICSYKIYASAPIETGEISDINIEPVMQNVIEATKNKIQKQEINLNIDLSATILYKTYEGHEMIAMLNVPGIGIEYPVLAENSDELLEITLNKFWGCNPNEVGNFCIVGHNYKSGKHFGKLKYVNIGDKVLLTDNTGRTLTYEVYDIYVIDPYDTKCTSQLTDGKKEVTLITCTNAGKNRLVVKAREVI